MAPGADATEKKMNGCEIRVRQEGGREAEGRVALAKVREGGSK